MLLAANLDAAHELYRSLLLKPPTAAHFRPPEDTAGGGARHARARAQAHSPLKSPLRLGAPDETNEVGDGSE
jgi:hypothetical protein